MVRMPVWDASVDLTSALLPAIAARAALPIDLIRHAVQQLEGAGEVSVEDCRGAPESLRWVTVYRHGEGLRRTGTPWDEVASRIQDAVRSVLAA